MKVLVVLGTRPEVIKLAPVIAALHGRVETVVCTTGQHREMLAQALEAFGIRPDVELDAMRPGQSLNALASRILADIDGVLEQVRPDWVLVQGDTTTAFCAALAAFHRGVAVGHVEAGLRTGDLKSPFPEEANRSLLARIATVHFAPTAGARSALLQEGVPDGSIVVTGNTVVDAIAMAQSTWTSKPPIMPPELGGISPNVPLVLVTCHRRENFGGVLAGICAMLGRLCLRYPDHRFVFPVHLNPGVRGPVMESLAGIPNLSLVDPVDYHANLWLISRSVLIISDSGGIQEEAPSFGVPVVVMRSHTERREGIDAGFATLAGQDSEAIEAAARRWLDDASIRQALKDHPNPYGDGQASRRIVAALLDEKMGGFHG